MSNAKGVNYTIFLKIVKIYTKLIYETQKYKHNKSLMGAIFIDAQRRTKTKPMNILPYTLYTLGTPILPIKDQTFQ